MGQPNDSVFRECAAGLCWPNSQPTDTRVSLKISTPNESLLDIFLCADGFRTHGNGACGYLDSWNAARGGQTGLGRSDAMSSCPGDSGAAVLNADTNRAYGLLEGADWIYCDGPTWFSWTAYVEQQSGYELLLKTSTERIKKGQALRGEFEDQRLESPNGATRRSCKATGTSSSMGPRARADRTRRAGRVGLPRRARISESSCNTMESSSSTTVGMRSVLLPQEAALRVPR